MRWLRVLVFIPLAILLALPASAAKTSRHEVECEGARYSYLLSNANEKAAQPALLLLHGAGGSPEPMIEAWKKKAEAEGITLVAPAVPRDLKFEPVAPAVFRCIVEDAAKSAVIDRDKIYLFGYSMGGYLAFDAAMLDSGFYQGAAIYANGIADDYLAILDKAQRKIPIALYVGDKDQVYPIEQVRKTHTVLEKHGYTVRYRELKGRDHNYFAVSGEVNDDAWKFFLDQAASPKAKNNGQQ